MSRSPTALVCLAALVITGLSGPAGRAAEPKVTKIDVESKNILPCARWADDKGTKAYLLDGTAGALLEVEVSTGKVTTKKDFEVKLGWLDASAEGLILSVPDKGQVWVLDDKLAVAKKIDVTDLGQAASSPKLSIAVVGSVKNGPLQVLDLKTGKAAKVTTTSKKFGRTLGKAPVVSPDGKYAFTEDGNSTIRFTIEDGKLTPEETIRSGSNPSRIVVSPDSKLVARPAGGGNPDLDGNYRLGVFSTESLKKKECVMDFGPYPIAVGFDPAAKRIYTTSHEEQLIVANQGGVKKGAYKIGKESPRQLLAHPDGNKVLIVAQDQVSFVELPKE